MGGFVRSDALDAKYRHPVMERLDGLFRVSLGVQESYAIC